MPLSGGRSGSVARSLAIDFFVCQARLGAELVGATPAVCAISPAMVDYSARGKS
jgi:hypothetical protein